MITALIFIILSINVLNTDLSSFLRKRTYGPYASCLNLSLTEDPNSFTYVTFTSVDYRNYKMCIST